MEDVLVVFELGLSVVLFVKIDLNLLQQWLAKDTNGDVLMLLEKDNEVLQHFFPHIKIGIAVYKYESQGFVKNRSKLVSFTSKSIE